MLRRQLVKFGLTFPIYDYACALYAQKTGRPLSTIIPLAEMDLTSAIIDLIAKTSYGALIQALFNLIDKHFGEKAALYFKERKIEEDDLWRIKQLPENKLFEYIPLLFAQDLRYAVSTSNSTRLILFFDTHEAFWGDRRDGSFENDINKDAWFRSLLLNLIEDPKIIIIVAGREVPRWNLPVKNKIELECLDIKQISSFTRHDAIEYLKRAGVDKQMHRCMLEVAQETPDLIHPFYLGLCVDVWQLALSFNKRLTPDNFIKSHELKEKRKELRNRLLRNADKRIAYAVSALSVCRSFDEDLYYYLGAKLHFPADKPTFDIIVSFSFIRVIQSKGTPRYQVHNLLRPLAEENDEFVITTDTILEEYYFEKSKKDPTLIAEKVYHANRLDQERGLAEWKKIFDESLEYSRYDICQALMEIQLNLKVDSNIWRGIIAESVGSWLFNMSRYNEAKTSFQTALSAYQSELNINSNQAEVITYKGTALQRLGDLLTATSKHSDALQAYQDSIASFDQALLRAPDYIDAHYNKSLTLVKYGILVSEYDPKVAITLFNNALIEINECIRLSSINEQFMELKSYIEKLINDLNN